MTTGETNDEPGEIAYRRRWKHFGVTDEEHLAFLLGFEEGRASVLARWATASHPPVVDNHTP